MADRDFAAVGQQTEEHIKFLDPMEHVRKRPGMYVGGTDARALHHLIYEVVDNSIDEALAGRCDHITVTLYPDNVVSVQDNGGGIPVGMNREAGMSTLQLVMTKIGAGGKFDSGAYKVSGGLHGVGVSAVNALSDELIAEVHREGSVYQQVYHGGRPAGDVIKIRDMEPGEATGTIISFKPDFTIMEPGEFNFNTLMQRFREMAFVTRRVTITLRDERESPLPREMTFYIEGGLKSFVRYLNRNRESLHPVVYAERDVDIQFEGKPSFTIGIDVAFQYTDSANVTEMAFANTISTPDGGTHLTGLRSAITGVINRYARKAGFLKEKDSNFSGNDTLEGITAIISVKHPHPSFESQTKVKLLNPETQGAASQVITEAFNEFMEMNPRDAKRIVEKCALSMRAREAARKARDLVRSGPSLLESTTLPGKLADCSDHGENAEVYIVEGDSAGGCFSGDTRVLLTDGRALSFVELIDEQAQGKEHFCYTIRRDGQIGVERILHPRVTKRDAEVIRVTLDNGETVVCTPDHRFMLRDGSYKPAAALTPDEALMSRADEAGYAFAAIEQSLMIGGAAAVYAPVAEAVISDYRVVSIDTVRETIDVYDIEVPNTHNFALASGVFVHNSAKQGRDRHFQAILPLRGKILNTERARLDKMLDNNEIKALISALGTGISDEFTTSTLRYNKVIIMSVAGDEPTLVQDDKGQIEFVHIGPFIDECIEGKRDPAKYQVMCFDTRTQATRFRPLKAVIRHPHYEPMYRITTRYNRSVKVTSSHSVFVYGKDGMIHLKKGNEVRKGDQLVASRRLPRAETSPTEIDLLNLFYSQNLAHALYVQGEDVKHLALAGIKSPYLREPQVSLNVETWNALIAQRIQQGLSQKQVAEAIGIKQPITISQWERGIYRPTLPKFQGYLKAIQWSEAVDYLVLPPRVEQLTQQTQTSKNARWRVFSDYRALDELSQEQVTMLGRDVCIVPQAHADKAFSRHLPITRELVWLLGWFVAEGTLSKHQVSLNLGEKDMPFIPEMIHAVEQVFGETPRLYHSTKGEGIKFYFHSVAAARLFAAWGLKAPAHRKCLPDIVFTLSAEMQLAFLEGYFLGDGTLAPTRLSVTTNSPLLKDGLLYLFGQLGLVASHTEMPAQTNARITTRHNYFNISISGKSQLENCQAIWRRHANAEKLQAYIGTKGYKPLGFAPIKDDLMGLEVLSAEMIDPVGEYVYDFSVESDENFICGVGGLCAHNTDADVDGAHIRTLLLTFFFRHMQPMIREGHLYIAQPPIFRIQNGKDVRYIYNEPGMGENDLLVRAVKTYDNPDKLKVSRYKGLGEMNPDQLWETTMDPARRTLLQVNIEDASEADRVFDMLMGSAVPPRRKFIQTHAKTVRNLDV